MSYTQSPHLTNDEIEIFLKEVQIARICTFNEDGTIHAVPVWFKYENGQFTIATPEKSRKIRNIIRNNNLTLLIDVEGPPTRGVIVYGTAKVDLAEWDSEALSLLEKYLPKEDARKTLDGLNKLAKWVKISIKPTHMASFDYAKDKKYWKAVSYSAGAVQQ
ncbi:MAG: pyridoxamine 5'-phosphate oxidase family protein [Candidatus Hermodarchaeota archaeon]